MAGRRLPMFPLGTVLFPHAVIPLHVFEPRYRALMQDCLDGDRRFGVVLIERGSEVGGGDQRAEVGTEGMITRAAELPDGRWVLEVTGREGRRHRRMAARRPVSRRLGYCPSRGLIDLFLWGRGATSGAIRSKQSKHCASRRPGESGGHAPCWPNTVERRPFRPTSPSTARGSSELASWQLCAAAPISPYDAQRLLTAENVKRRLTRLVRLMEDLELDVERMLTAE